MSLNSGELKETNQKKSAEVNILDDIYSSRSEYSKIKYADYRLTGATTDKISIIFKTKVETMQAYKDLMEKGYVDTSNAVVIMTEYLIKNHKYNSLAHTYIVDKE